jgi:alpha-1,6-mannosyltransferase
VKVLDVTEFFSERGGGIRSYLTAKGQVLCTLGVEHRVVAPGQRNESSLLAHATTDSSGAVSSQLIRLRGPRQPYDHTYHFFTNPRKIHEVIAREQPDVLEVHSPYVAALAALSARRTSFGVRTLLWHTAHLEIYLRPTLKRHVPQRLQERVLGALWAPYRLLARGFQATLALSHWQAELLRAQGLARVVAVPFGVRKQIFTPQARDASLRAELLGPGRESGTLLVGAGRLAAEKRFDLVLDAFMRFRRQHEAVLLLLGDGPERAALERRVQGRDDVRFLGFESDPRRLAVTLASADAMVHAAPAETFSITVAEAISCGLPVVVPDAGAVHELAGGPSCEVYAAEDPDACHQALERLLGRDAGEVRRGAIAAAERVGSVQQHFEQVVKLYTELLRDGARQGPARAPWPG